MDWDLDALAGIDEAALLDASEQAHSQKYPVRNPMPPPVPPGYVPTGWVRCVVESVHDGILDTLPDEYPDDPISPFGKASTCGPVLTADYRCWYRRVPPPRTPQGAMGRPQRPAQGHCQHHLPLSSWQGRD